MTNVNFNNLEIFIERNYYRNHVSVWVTETNPSENHNISCEDGKLIRTKLDPTESVQEDIKPFLNVPRHFFDVLIKSLADSNSNIVTENENLIKGKLLATEEHLKDMREFSKKLLDSAIRVDKDLKL